MSGSSRRIELIVKSLTSFIIHVILAILVGLFYFEVHYKRSTVEKWIEIS